MSVYSMWLFLVAMAIHGCAPASAVGDKLTVVDSESNGELSPVAETQSPAFLSAPKSHFSLNLMSAFPEDLDISSYCLDLLRIFGQHYTAYANCLVPSARPVKVCQNCFAGYRNLNDTYTNISSDTVCPGSLCCRDSLLHSDRLMLVFQLYSNMEDLWTASGCDNCLTNRSQSLNNDTLQFIAAHNQTLTCFEKYQQQGNQSELCTECKATYKDLNKLYDRQEKSGSLCIDIEDSMNITRRLWSKNFNCSFPREETVPVIAVSSFMLFLPVIFYLSSFLHSEQKKRKLIHPKRAKSNNSLMNIQDKFS